MKRILAYVLFFLLQITSAQVGVNTTDPKAQLDIVSSSATTPTNTDGILIPRITTFPAVNPTAAQNGMLVYLSTTSGSFSPGFYYWDNSASVWQPIAGTKVGTLDQAYDFGGVGQGRTITADAGAVTINGSDGLVSTGSLGAGALAPSGSGIRMVWNPRKAAFRAGRVSGVDWDDNLIGQASFASGDSPRASGINSVAFGFQTSASGMNATALGSLTFALGSNAFVFGSSNIVSGTNSFSGGSFNTVVASNASSMGVSNSIAGMNSVAFGNSNTISGQNSITSGQSNTLLGNHSSAFGFDNNAPSFAETVIGIGATTYTMTPSGATVFFPSSANDRIFTIGNAIDNNFNGMVDLAERSDAMVVLKNGNTGIGTSTPATRLHVVGNLRLVDGNQAVGKVLTSDGNGTATWQNATSLAWGISGNAGTNTTTNFIGTTDNVDLVFKRNNINAGLLGSSNTFFGLSSGINSTGTSNTYIGNLSGNANTSGELNTFLGRLSGANGSVGSGSTYLGYAAGLNNSGNNNIAVGAFSGQNTSGRFNVFIGNSSGNVNTTGERNTLLGNDSDLETSNLTNATALGNQAFVSASNALVLGSIIGINGAIASTSVGIGTTSPARRLHVAENTASTTNGQLYLEQQGTGDAIIHLGNTGARHYSFGLDTSADSFKISTSATTATALTTGTLMTLLPTGEVGIGTALPTEKLQVSGPAGLTVTRIANTSTGGSTSNVALDFFRATAINTDWRIYNIGPNLTIGNSGDDLTTVNELYQFQGSRFMPMTDGTLSLGQAANRWNTLFATNGTINTSDRREKQDIQPLSYGLHQLMQLKPVSFKWKNPNIDNHSVHLGFVAQDLQEVVPEVVVDSQWSNASEGAPRVWEKAPLLGVNYAEVIPILVKSIQEQQALISAQQAQLLQLQQRIEQLEKP